MTADSAHVHASLLPIAVAMILYSQVGRFSRVCPGTCSSIADQVRNWLLRRYSFFPLFAGWWDIIILSLQPFFFNLLLLAPEADAVYSASYVALHMAQGRPSHLMD